MRPFSPVSSPPMTGSWLEQDGPSLAPASALVRLADEPVLLMLHGGDSGWTYLCWGAAAVALDDVGDLRGAPGRAARAVAGAGAPAAPGAPGAALGASAWSGRFRGGWFVQLDYEYPDSPARCWQVDAFAAWDPAGRLRLHARERAGLEQLAGGLARPPRALANARLASALVPAWPAEGHRARSEAIRDYIAAGDVYQANLTVAFTARLQPGPDNDLAVFLALTGTSPAPFSALLRTPGRSIISHSPECFLTIADDLIASEPIKGTCRRIPGLEAESRRNLLASAKDRAELAMIVDLVRNDLGRVAAAGSVRVAEPARILDLPYVHHLVARIEARLRPEVRLPDILQAAFPAGSITGAPKRRAMSIIRELEGRPRGAYCGAFGWVGEHGDAELAVAIRTLVMTGDTIQLAAGGGIVADSDAAAEWDELRAKAGAMAHALGASL
jgi:para-aminobenzoate synthetase component 1